MDTAISGRLLLSRAYVLFTVQTKDTAFALVWQMSKENLCDALRSHFKAA